MLHTVFIYAHNSMPLPKGFRPERPRRKAQTKKYTNQPPDLRTRGIDTLRIYKPRLKLFERIKRLLFIKLLRNLLRV
jgi:hypothetical protein